MSSSRLEMWRCSNFNDWERCTAAYPATHESAIANHLHEFHPEIYREQVDRATRKLVHGRSGRVVPRAVAEIGHQATIAGPEAVYTMNEPGCTTGFSSLRGTIEDLVAICSARK